MSDRKYLGQMHIVRRSACGHVFAACWVTGNEADAAAFKRRHQRFERVVETLERYEGDEMPEWCNNACERATLARTKFQCAARGCDGCTVCKEDDRA